MALDQAHAADLVGALADLVRSARSAGLRQRSELGAAGTPVGVLKHLRGSDARPGDLAVALHVGPSVISRALVPLEQQGLIVRVTDPADARASLISLTDSGRERLDRLQDAYVERVREVLTDWSDAEADDAVAILERLERAIVITDDHPQLHQRLFDAAQIPVPPGDPASDPTRHLQFEESRS